MTDSRQTHTPDDEKAHRVAVKIAQRVMSPPRLLPLPLLQWFRRKRALRLGAVGFKVRADDGVKLDALYLPPLAEDLTKLPVVHNHGYFEHKEAHLCSAWALGARGHGVILYDHRHHGRSKGRYITFGVKERHDVRAVIDHAVREKWVKDKVITMGFSLGAGTMLQHAAMDDRVAGVVAKAPFLDMASAVRSFRRRYGRFVRHPWLMRGFEEATRRAGFNLHEASTLEAVKHITAPVLFIVGQDDKDLPAKDHTLPLYEAKTQGQRELLEVPGANHLTLAFRRWPGVEEAIVRFCDGVAQDSGYPAT